MFVFDAKHGDVVCQACGLVKSGHHLCDNFDGRFTMTMKESHVEKRMDHGGMTSASNVGCKRVTEGSVGMVRAQQRSAGSSSLVQITGGNGEDVRVTDRLREEAIKLRDVCFVILGKPAAVYGIAMDVYITYNTYNNSASRVQEAQSKTAFAACIYCALRAQPQKRLIIPISEIALKLNLYASDIRSFTTKIEKVIAEKMPKIYRDILVYGVPSDAASTVRNEAALYATRFLPAYALRSPADLTYSPVVKLAVWLLDNAGTACDAHNMTRLAWAALFTAQCWMTLLTPDTPNITTLMMTNAYKISTDALNSACSVLKAGIQRVLQLPGSEDFKAVNTAIKKQAQDILSKHTAPIAGEHIKRRT